MRGIAAATATAGLIFGVGGLSEDDLVAVGSGQADQSFAGNPSSDGLAFGFRVIFIGIFSRLSQNGFDVSPVAAGLDDDEFVSASSFAEFGCVGAGGDADGLFVDERAALDLGGGEVC